MELIKIEERDGVQFVNARELHNNLKVGRDFTTWISERIAKYGFIEGVDFSPVTGKSTGGRPSVEYLMSITMAKELAMLENNEEGKKVRLYLIKLESAWNTPEMVFARALQMANATIESFKYRAIEAERKNAVLMHVRKTYTAGEIAKELGMRSAQDLNQKLCEKKIQYKQNGTWLPCADYSDMGYFEIKQQELDNGTVIYDRRITQSGREFILNLFDGDK